MNDGISPTIRGIFINEHINKVRLLKGEEGVRELERRYGQPINFSNTENVPVREEIKILEAMLDIISDTPVPEEKRSYEAGRLHFKDFAETPLGRIIFSVFRGDFKTMMTKSQYIAEHVFKGIEFRPISTGEKSVVIHMSNADYPIEHFQGLFQEWMNYSGETGTVEAKKIDSGTYEYKLSWN